MVNYQRHADLLVKKYFKSFKRLRLVKNKVIVYSGDTPKGVYFLESGIVRQYIDSANGKELTIHLYNPKSFFPLFWAINHQIPDYNLQTITPCVVRIAPKHDFLDWLVSTPEVLYDLSSRLLFGLANLSKRIEIVSLENSSHRLKFLFAYLFRHYGPKIPYFTHESLAYLTGLTRERVSIEMKLLKNAEIVDYKRGLINILKPSKLKTM